MDDQAVSSTDDVVAIDRASIQSIDRAAQILELFDQDTLTLSPALVADRLGLNRTTAHRYLVSLQSSGLLGADFGPGALLDQLSTFVSGRRQVLQLAPPVMRELCDATGSTVVLGLWGRSGAVVALVEETTFGTIVITVRVGTVLPQRSAQTKVLVAFQTDPREMERHLAGFPDNERADVQNKLAKVRREKLAWAELDHLGLAAVAAPVFGSRDVQASLALIGTTKTVSLPERAAEVGMLQQAADRLSKQLGA